MEGKNATVEELLRGAEQFAEQAKGMLGVEPPGVLRPANLHVGGRKQLEDRICNLNANLQCVVKRLSEKNVDC